MRNMTPLLRISIGLVSMTISFLLIADALVGLVPEEGQQAFKYRASLSEALAVQYSELAQNGDVRTINVAMHNLVMRDPDILSAALLNAADTLLVKAGAHDQHWVQPPGDQSTLNHIQVPIFDGEVHWGTLQLAFRSTEGTGLWWHLTRPWVKFLGAVAVFGFLGYLLYMKRTLRHLDPSAVIPQRVKAALDVLGEGVVLIDTGGYIVLANASFGSVIEQEADKMIGKPLSKLPWERPDSETSGGDYPWIQAMKEKKPQTGGRLVYTLPGGEMKHFLVNSAPILEERGALRGVLTSFNDVTELDRVNDYLMEVVKELETSKAEIVRQNGELEGLATRDPLTGCLNRRAFFDRVAPTFAMALQERTELCCIMLDIDHFKKVNDQHGHSVGDEVISVVARTITASIRPSDFLCRYGGEEFCLVLPESGAVQAMQIANRIRRRVAIESGAAIRMVTGLRVTASLGVSTTFYGATELSQLIEQADQSLYKAKETGRNRVINWQELEGGSAPAVELPDEPLSGGESGESSESKAFRLAT